MEVRTRVATKKSGTISIFRHGADLIFPIVLKQMGYTYVTAIDAFNKYATDCARKSPQIWRRNTRYYPLLTDECPGVDLSPNLLMSQMQCYMEFGKPSEKAYEAWLRLSNPADNSSFMMLSGTLISMILLFASQFE